MEIMGILAWIKNNKLILVGSVVILFAFLLGRCGRDEPVGTMRAWEKEKKHVLDSIGKREVMLLAQLEDALTDRDKSREREAVLHSTISDLETDRVAAGAAYIAAMRNLSELKDAPVSEVQTLIIKTYEEATGDTAVFDN